MNIQTLKSCKETKYTKSIKVKVIKKINDWKEFTSSTGRKGKFLKLIVADNTGSIQAVVYDECHNAVLQEGASVLLRGYSFRQNLVITSQTKIYSCEPVITGNIQMEQPPASPIKDVNTSPEKTLITVEGKVIQEEATKSVPVGQRTAKVKEMTLKDESGEVKISLWDEMTTTNVKCGDKIIIADGTVKFSKFHQQNTVSVGNLSTITLLPSEEETYQKITILAATILNENDLEIYCRQNDDEIEFICAKQHLGMLLVTDDGEESKINPLSLPINCEVKLQGKRVVDLIQN